MSVNQSQSLSNLVGRIGGLSDYQRYQRTYSVLLVLLAWEAGELSAEYVAELLQLDPVSARELRLQMIAEAKERFLPREPFCGSCTPQMKVLVGADPPVTALFHADDCPTLGTTA